MGEEKECFIIMPIITPKHAIDNYRDGQEHFKHVLDCLFIPAVKEAGYKPIPPKAAPPPPSWLPPAAPRPPISKYGKSCCRMSC